MLWVKLAGSWGHLIDNIGLSSTFITYGIAFAVMVIIGGMWMKFPPAGWKPEGYEAAETVASESNDDKEFSSSEMIRKPQFYLIFFTFIVSAGAGLMSIGLMKLYPMEALQA